MRVFAILPKNFRPPEFLVWYLELYDRDSSQKPPLIADVIFVLVLTVVGIFAPLVAPHDPVGIDISEAKIAPVPFGDNLTWSHPLGTDILGQDILSRMVYGLRIAVFFGVLALLLATVSSKVLLWAAAMSSVFKNTEQLPPSITTTVGMIG